MTAINEMLQQPFGQAIGWALLQFVWQGTFVALLTAALLAALRRSGPDVRYVVSTIALALMLTMPVVTVVQMLAATSPVWEETAGSLKVSTSPAELPAPVTPAVDSPPAAMPALAAPVAWSVDEWLPLFVSVWLAGVALLTLRLFSGWMWAQRMKSHGARPAPEALQTAAERLMRRLHIGRAVRLLASTSVSVPTVIGWLKPVVLLPTSALAGLAPNQMEAILAHELAHVRRHDYIVNLFQTVVETLLFYHPAVWWLSRRIRAERENCCDDLAVSLCGDPVAYAAALAELEGLRSTTGDLVLAATGGSLLQRVRRLLGVPTHAGRAPGWLAAGLALLVVISMSAGAVARDALIGEWQVAAPAAPVVPPAPAQPASTRPVVAVDPIAPPAPSAPPPAIAAVPPSLPVPSVVALPSEPALVATTPMVPAPVGIAPMVPAPLATPPMVPTPAVPFAGVTSPLPAMPVAIAPMAAPFVGPATLPLPALAPAVPVVAAPAVAQTASSASSQSTSHTTNDGEKSGNWVWSDNGKKFEVNYRGDIEFTDDDSDVSRMSPGGYLRIKDGQRFGTDNSVEFRAGSGGAIERRFWVSGRERPFDPEGRKWLAEVLPKFIRQSGIGAKSRVARFMKSGGAAAVLAEISRIEGSWAKRVYFTELFNQPGLSGAAIQQALRQAGREVDSDFELASLLIASNRIVSDDAVRRSYLEAARSIGSDFELRRVLSSIVKAGPMTPAIAASVLDTSGSIDSDFEQASLLVEFAARQPFDGPAGAAFFKALAGVSSSFEHNRVLKAVLQRTDLSEPVRVAALESGAAIESDFELASFLTQFVKTSGVEGAARAPFFRAAASIDSAFERSRVLQALSRRTDVSDATVLEILRSAQSINSNFERAQVLLAVAGAHPLTREARDMYIDASNNLGDFEQGRVLSALVRNERGK